MRNMPLQRERYMPVFAEAAAATVRSRSEEEDRFALSMLGKCYINGEKFICPYDETDNPRLFRRPVIQLGNQHFLWVFTSQEEALKADCFKVMETPVVEVVQTVLNSDDDPPFDGLAVNLHSGRKEPMPYIALRSELKEIDQQCRDTFERFIIPKMMEMQVHTIKIG